MAAEKVLIQGESGTGKTFSMKDLDPNTTAIVSPEKTRLPFRNQFKMLIGKTDSKDIIKFIDECVKEGRKSIVIDDFQYILAIPYMHRIHESGWDKYNDFGGNYFEIIDHCKTLPDDVIVYFMTHTETLEDGVTRTKLIGKLLREKITIEGLFTIVLKTVVADGKYYFATQNSGKDTVKTPFEMFDTYAIENNLAYVDEKIRSYYYMKGAKSDEEMKQIDEEVAAPEVEKPAERRRSRKTETEEPKTRRSRTRTTDTEAVKQEVEKVSEMIESAETVEESTPRRRSRKSRIHEEAEKQMKVQFDTIEEVADGRESVQYDEVMEALDKKVKEDTYIKTSDGNFKKLHTGDTLPESAEIITKEEFNEGVKTLAQSTSEAPKRRTRKARS